MAGLNHSSFSFPGLQLVASKEPVTRSKAVLCPGHISPNTKKKKRNCILLKENEAYFKKCWHYNTISMAIKLFLEKIIVLQIDNNFSSDAQSQGNT